jgi:hypothetical protein
MRNNKHYSLSAKSVLALTMIILLGVGNSCDDPGASAANSMDKTDNHGLITPDGGEGTMGANKFHKGVGGPIDKTTANRWINNFRVSGRAVTNLSLHAESLRQILSIQGCIGISLCYATDDTGNLIVIPVGVDNKGMNMIASTIDLQTRTIDWSTATNWMSNYSGEIRSHFFGANTFKRLLDEKGVEQIRLTKASNDNGELQLLLSDMDSIDPDVYEDKSWPCPSYCSN